MSSTINGHGCARVDPVTSFGLAGTRLCHLGAIALVAVCFLGAPAVAQIVEDHPCEPSPVYAKVSAGWADDASGFRDWLTRERYERIVSSWECRRITYRSDGLRIAGFICRPVDAGKRHAAIVVNRGGTGNRLTEIRFCVIADRAGSDLTSIFAH